MRSESMIVTVLPLTSRSGADFHVSLHIAPRLMPDGAEEPLSRFPIFSDWATHLAGANFSLLDQTGSRIAHDIRRVADAGLWQNCFPGDTPVRRPRASDLSTREWASFPVKAVHDLAAITAVGSALWFPIDPPDLKTILSGRRNPLRELIGSLGFQSREGHGGRRRFNDDEITSQLDKGKAVGGILAEPLRVLHQARRFYEPVGGNKVTVATLEPVPLPEPDFHERVAHLAEQPALLRRLGLVIDLVVSDLAALRGASELSARIDLEAHCRVVSSRTPVIAEGERLFVKPAGTDWKRGLLQLGDEKRFAALTMDSDGAAMKLGNFLRALPRMLSMADNGDPGHVAPPALRSEGFTVVRTGRLAVTQAQVARAETMTAALSTGAPPLISAEDVTLGMRVEIWDDREARWFSPHRRLSTATLRNGDVIYRDLLETGWAQTAAVRTDPTGSDDKAYLHEALFGWSGWSLSAPRPGPRAEPAATAADGAPLPPRGQREVVAPPPDDGEVTPIVIETKVAPGTLPRLRYGRSYAFRAWAVDLAGNSAGGTGFAGGRQAPVPGPRPIRGEPERGGDGTAPASGRQRHRQLARDIATAAPVISELATAARTEAPDLARNFAAASRLRAQAEGSPTITGDESIDRLIVARMAPRAFAQPLQSQGDALAAQLRSGLDSLSLDTAEPLRPEIEAIPDLGPAFGAGAVTPLLPFRRWDPVPPPVVVARHRYSPAESVHHLVIRSDIAADGTRRDPAATIAALPPEHTADWRATSERHLAAPKGSQHLNELHGRFDEGIDDAAARRRLLAAALRDDGTLYDSEIVALDDPSLRVPQPGVSLEAGPEVTDPKTDLSAYLGANRGEPIPAGHYVVHDTDRLALPWLPDPLAAGIALGMRGANGGSPLIGLFRTESTAARYDGTWPAPMPFRLVLDTADGEPRAEISDGVVRIALPPGTRLDLRLSSSLRKEDLDLLALWNLFPAPFRAMDLVRRPAADGQFWSLTPFEPITLVHAVPRPVLAPVIVRLTPVRLSETTHCDFIGVAECHASSTDRLDAEASWTETVDDLSRPGPIYAQKHSGAFSVPVNPDEDILVLSTNPGNPDDTEWAAQIPGMGPIRIHRARQEFGDTKARLVTYALRATTRFREYFPPNMLASPDDQSRLGETMQVMVPSSATPPAPEVDMVVPLFRWDESGSPGQPFGMRRRRRSGLRIYLKRPWFRTGHDEQLAVLFSLDPADDSKSLWASDPVWLNAGPPTPYVVLSLEDFYSGTFALDSERGSDPRINAITGPLSVPPATRGGNASFATAIGYRPEYSDERQMWFVDVAIEPGAAVWPFVRLVVARYQPNSLPGLELSPAVTCDFAQLPPERTLTLTRPDEGTVRVTVTGPVGIRDHPDRNPGPSHDVAQPPYPFGQVDITNWVAANRRMYATVQRRAAGLASDLDWEDVVRHELSIGGLGADGNWAWTGVVPFAQPSGPATPASNDGWRVLVREVERIDADPDADGTKRYAERTIYADIVEI